MDHNLSWRLRSTLDKDGFMVKFQFKKNDYCVGCRPVGYDCSPGMFLRDENSCVHKRDCPCTSFNGTQIKVIEKGKMKKCQINLFILN